MSVTSSAATLEYWLRRQLGRLEPRHRERRVRGVDERGFRAEGRERPTSGTLAPVPERLGRPHHRELEAELLAGVVEDLASNGRQTTIAPTSVSPSFTGAAMR